jgi:hypothetical protein
MAEESIREMINRRLIQDTQMTAAGVKQLLDGSPITNAEDRKRLAGHLLYLYGRLDTCPLPPPRNPGHRGHT